MEALLLDECLSWEVLFLKHPFITVAGTIGCKHSDCKTNFPMSTNSSFSSNDPKKRFKLIHTRKTVVSSRMMTGMETPCKVTPVIWRSSVFSCRSTNYVSQDFKPKPIAPAEAKSLFLGHSKVHVNPTEIRSVCEGYGLTKKGD